MDKPPIGDDFREEYSPYYSRASRIYTQRFGITSVDKIARLVFVDSHLDNISDPLNEYNFTYYCHVLASRDNVTIVGKIVLI